MAKAKSQSARLGFFGGTFDPVHPGHLKLAAIAERRLGLDRIFFVPAEMPWHKAAPQASFADRYAMLALALAGRPRWLPLELPAARPGAPTYSVDQIAALQGRYPGAEIFFITGADSFATLQTWKQPRKLLAACDFMVFARTGFGVPELLAALPRAAVLGRSEDTFVLSNGRHIYWIPREVSRASSTDSKKRGSSAHAATALPLTGRVAAYIKRADLY